jgi:hypothetical protein
MIKRTGRFFDLHQKNTRKGCRTSLKLPHPPPADAPAQRDWPRIGYERPISPQREREVGSNAVAALPSGEASQLFNS